MSLIKEEEEPSGHDMKREATTVASRADEPMNRHESPGLAPQEEIQRAQVMLDPETTGMIRQMAREQRELRTEVRDMRQELFEVRVMMKTHDVRLDQVLKRVGDVIDDKWGLRATVEEVKKLQETAEVRDRTRTPTQTPNINTGPERSPRLRASTVTDIESLYASEDNHLEQGAPEAQNQGRDGAMQWPEVDDRVGHHKDMMEAPGEVWIKHRNEQWFGLGIEEALEGWYAASDASCGRRALRQPRMPEPQRQRGQGTCDLSGDQAREPRRSVTQPHEVGFGRHPNLSTPSGDDHQAGEQGRQPSGGSGSGSSDNSRQGGGGLDRRSWRGSSNTGDRSQARPYAFSKYTIGDGCSSKRRRRKRSPSSSSSPSSSEDWDSDWTVLDDEDRIWWEKRELKRNPETEYEQEQLGRICERTQKMVGQDIQYAATYKGVEDIVPIVKYSGQNDNGIFTRWLDHLLLYFRLNRMCGPDNELVRLSAMYNLLGGVAEEWYRDLILHTPKRSWTFEKAVCSLFLTYVFGSAASQAAEEFGKVKYSHTEGAREYVQRLKTKARRLVRKPNESTVIIRFLAGLPVDLSRQLTLQEKVVTMQKENPSWVAMHQKVERPRRGKAHESCLAAFVEIDGMEAFTLFDSGSSADTISPDFAQVSDAGVNTLDKPMPLQLGTVGSRAPIDCGTWTSVKFGGWKEERHYLDVVNIDCYNVILGAPFMRKFGVRLDFRSNLVIVGEAAAGALLPEEEAVLLKGREIRQEPQVEGHHPHSGVTGDNGGPVSGDRDGDLDQISSGESAARLVAIRTTPVESDVPQLREGWAQECQKMFVSQPDELPPLKEINHRIQLIDGARTYHHRQPRCPDAFKPALMAKIECYMSAGWWVPITASRATPMLCIPKSAKNLNELRTVFDLREQNANTHKDLTPMPDQDAIRHAVAKAQYRSKCQISNAYELFLSPYSEGISHQDDCWLVEDAAAEGTSIGNAVVEAPMDKEGKPPPPRTTDPLVGNPKNHDPR